MSWTHIPSGKMVDALNHLHSELVFNAIINMAQKPGLTVGELRELLDIIENEAIAINNLEKGGTCTYEASEYGDGKLWYECSACGGHVSAEYDAPKFCPHCGRAVEGRDSCGELGRSDGEG